MHSLQPLSAYSAARTNGIQRILRSALFLACAATVALTAACSSDNPIASGNLVIATPSSLVSVNGNAQSAAEGSPLAQSLTVRAITSTGAIVSGATVAFQVTSGSASLSSSSVVTDSTGIASVQAIAGTTAGTVIVTASIGTSITATFTITVTAASTTATCTPTSLAIGAAVVITGNSACVTPGSAAAEYAIIPFNAATTATSKATFAVNAAGVTAVSTTIATSSLVSDGSSGSLASAGALASVSARRTFEQGLRSREREAMKSHLAGARSWNVGARTGSGARFNIIPSTATVGSIYSLNANADVACSNPSYRAGRIMAIGTKALIVADTLNPTGGFTQAEYQSIADTFDNVVDAVDTKNFGQPTDIDGNGHVILFFTSAVNALTPKNASYYIGGFFYGRDLLPASGASPLGTCAGSNTAEMFYLLVADPNGLINGNTFSKSFVMENTIGTTAHEYQHLINASRRMYINTEATDFEETWLDEGMAHMAEELVFYARGGLNPLMNIDATLLRSNNAYRTAFNEQGISNFERLGSFIGNPTANSPYADNDSLATRGATWSFLRYAADQQTTTQSTIWYNIVNSGSTGLTNLNQVFGSTTPLLRDWATSLLLDDVTGATSRYQFGSWNLRSIFGAINSNVYPIATQSLNSGATTSVSVAGGSAAYLRFGVAAGATGSLSWTTSSANMQETLVRLK